MTITTNAIRAVGAALASTIGLFGAGCTDTPTTAPPSPPRLDDAAMACVPASAEYRLIAVDPAVHRAGVLDVDGDGIADDALGLAHDAIATIDPAFAVAPRFGERLATDIAWLVAVDRCGDDVRVTIDRGFTLDGGVARVERNRPRAVGAPVDGAGTFVARDGSAELPLVALADPLARAGSGWTAVDGVVVRAVATTDALTGVFAGAIDADLARARLAAPIAAFLDAQPAGDVLRAGADADHDGVVTADEIAASTTFRALVTGDVIVRAPDGSPRGDGAPRVSVAFAFTAVRVR